jgi:hypothetical protein
MRQFIYILILLTTGLITTNGQNDTVKSSLQNSCLGLTPDEIIHILMTDYNEYIVEIKYTKDEDIPLKVIMKHGTFRGWYFNEYNIANVAVMAISNNMMKETTFQSFNALYTRADTALFTEAVGDTTINFNFFYYKKDRTLNYIATYGCDPILLRKHYSDKYILTKR